MTTGQDQHDNGARLEELIERSSLGAPGARQLRARITPAEGRRISGMADAVAAGMAATASAGGGILLAWDVAAARDDDRGQAEAMSEGSRMMADALGAAGVRPLEQQDWGDGGRLMVLSPGGEDAVARIIGALDDSTWKTNSARGPAGRVSLRLAVTGGHAGRRRPGSAMSGTAVARACRLAAAAGLVLADSGADFAVMIDASLGEHLAAIDRRTRGRLYPLQAEPPAAAWVYLPMGARLRPAAADPAAVLTWQEWEIADLLTRGLSKREVAVKLGITDRTVRFGVERIYRKLGISSREEILARLGQQHRPAGGGRLADERDTWLRRH